MTRRRTVQALSAAVLLCGCGSVDATVDPTADVAPYDALEEAGALDSALDDTSTGDALVPSDAIDGGSSGPLIADPTNPRWLRWKNGSPVFVCGPGDPEGFLYRGTRNADGTRAGDQLALIDKLRGTGANAIYFIAVRSHGGDGTADQNPFVSSNPALGLDPKILDQWETWFTALDDAGVIMHFFLYDDSASIWNTGDAVGASERAFVKGLVGRFKHHRGIVWVVAEEYEERFSAKRVSALAAEIRSVDEHHPIGVHKLDGLAFGELANDPNVDQFTIQYNKDSASELHGGMVTAFRDAAGRYNLNLSEAFAHGNGAIARQKNWAAATAGAYVMALGWDIASTPVSDLRDCGRLVRFMQAARFERLAPHDELRAGGTQYVLAAPGQAYVAYAASATSLGIKGLTAGSYRLEWLDPSSGATSASTVTLGAGDQTFTPPASFGAELALWAERK